MAPAPVGRAVAMTRRGDERDALDQAAPLVGHERHPPPAQDRDVRASPAPRQLHSWPLRRADVRSVEVAVTVDLRAADESEVDCALSHQRYKKRTPRRP